MNEKSVVYFWKDCVLSSDDSFTVLNLDLSFSKLEVLSPKHTLMPSERFLDLKVENLANFAKFAHKVDLFDALRFET